MKEVANLIIQNKQGHFLLYLRDNKPSIPFPHFWDAIGGHIEAGETPEQALKREFKEELGMDLGEYTFFRKYEVTDGDAYPNTKYVYHAIVDKPLGELTLLEGERLQFFTVRELKDLPVANIHKQIIFDYIAS